MDGIRTIMATVAVLAVWVGMAQAGFVDNFDQAAFDARWGLDTPNPALGDITLDTVNDWAHFQAYGNTDMWGSRNNAPILWTPSPAGDFYIETRVTMPAAQNGTVSGLVVYGDGVGSDDGEKPNFSVGLDQWGAAHVKIQGLGTNNPATAIPVPAGQAWLRLEVDRDGGVGGVDRYSALYKLNAGDPWQHLAILDRDVPNARMGLVMKTSDRSRSSDFSYAASGELAPAAPVWNLWSVDIQGSGSPVTMTGREAAFGRGNIWNAFNVAHHSGTSLDPSMALVDSEGNPSGATFSITGRVSGYNANVSDPLGQDYLFINAGSSAANLDWAISGLTPNFLYDLYIYGAIGGSRDFNMLIDSDGDGDLSDEIARNVGTSGLLFDGLLPNDQGVIIGQMLNNNREGNWSGFQIAQVSDVPEPATLALIALASAGIGGYVRRRR
ncbi:MAG: PEP-CTERM motif protein [Planctomycetes bacterium ADurb.Bin126]|nr:MAG: PEP-CTERM motif protein [Planctomycetes bacterium ADurb.Bin126]HOD82047.1 PEP-CTERM sorting domain-containing protein [Phycisphaerae bacterium]HQL72166.1 PEP-CTERM sorting domain-containing protein [Phycisphaerae bacterium]